MPAQLDKENVKMTDCADCNVFQFCQFLKLLGKVMIILVLLIVGLTYWAVITATTAADGTVGTKAWNVLIVVVFTVLVRNISSRDVCSCWHTRGCLPALTIV